MPGAAWWLQMPDFRYIYIYIHSSIYLCIYLSISLYIYINLLFIYLSVYSFINLRTNRYQASHNQTKNWTPGTSVLNNWQVQVSSTEAAVSLRSRPSCPVVPGGLWKVIFCIPLFEEWKHGFAPNKCGAFLHDPKLNIAKPWKWHNDTIK